MTTGRRSEPILNRTLRLVRRPVGTPVPDDWIVGDEELPPTGPGQVMVKVEHISIDPAARGWLDDRPSYVPPVRLGDVMRAVGTGRVVESRDPRTPVGADVQGMVGVRRYAVLDGRALTRVNPALGTPRDYLGILGQTGLTAYFGLFELGLPRAGDTVVVSAAAGAVGSIAGQLARMSGCRVVGIAGGPQKCRYIMDELGFNAAIDYRAEDLHTALARECPDGIDVYFDNVGGDVLDAVLLHLALRARIVVCGAISQYNAEPTALRHHWQLLVRRARMQGFLVFDYADRYPEARARLAQWHRNAVVRAPETVLDGDIDDYPNALLRLFRGDNIGKLLLRVGGPGE